MKSPPLRTVFGWMAKTCFRGWRWLHRAWRTRMGVPPNPRPPRPVVRQFPEGTILRTRLDRRATEAATLAARAEESPRFFAEPLTDREPPGVGPSPGVALLRHPLPPRGSGAGGEGRVMESSDPTMIPSDPVSNAIMARVREASELENRRMERELLDGKFLPSPGVLRASGTVFQASAVSSTEPGLVAWISATPMPGPAPNPAPEH